MPVYKDKQRGTWYISTSYTPKKRILQKKKTVRGFKKKSDALNYERVIMIQLKQKAKYNFVLGLKLEDVWKEYSHYMTVIDRMGKILPTMRTPVSTRNILNLIF